jgi:hypothetical protein
MPGLIVSGTRCIFLLHKELRKEITPWARKIKHVTGNIYREKRYIGKNIKMDYRDFHQQF